MPRRRLRTPGPATLRPPVAERPRSRHSARSTESSRLRHALLKSDEPGSQSVEKDLPIPAVLAREPSNIAARDDPSETRIVAVPARRSSLTNLVGQYERPLIGVSPQAEWTCIDPRLHPFSTHVNVHHRGLVEGGDPGLPVDRESPVRSPVAFSATGASSGNTMFGRIQRVLTGGDVCEEVVDVSSHIHRNHPASVKVRPALGLSYNQERHDIREGVSKVRPVEGLLDKETIYDRDYPLTGTERRPASRVVLWDQANANLLGNAGVNVPSRGRRSSNSEKSTAMQSNATVRLIRPPKIPSQAPEESHTSAAHHQSSVSLSNPSRGNRHNERKPVPPIMPQGLHVQEPNSRRTVRWFRKLLGYGGTQRPRLTTLPARSHRRRVNQPDGRVGTARKRAVRFYSEDTSDVEAINSAVHNLERILNEALRLADDVTALRVRGRVGEPSTPAVLPGISEAANRSLPSVHESLRSDCTDDSEGSSLVFRPTAFLGAADLPAHGCEALPLRSLIRRGLASNIHSGNIIGPNLPPRISSLHGANKLSRTGRGNLASSRRKSTGFQRIAESASEDFNSCVNGDTFCHHPKGVNTWSLDGGSSDNVIDFGPQYRGKGPSQTIGPPASKWAVHNHTQPNTAESTGASHRDTTPQRMHELRHISLKNRSHISLADMQRFSLIKSVKRQPIARDWSPARKRYVATIACVSTAVVGILVGIYAGLVPSIQYYIADFHHYATIGNVALYSGMAFPTFLCWPLPLLHGRKPYIVCSLSVALPLLFPQAMAVSTFRSPDTYLWKTVLLLPRGLMGFVLGFASMNFHSILTDLFGASLMSSKPHQEVVDLYDVRRHGGGLGIWLGIWTWCWIGSLSIGFLIGALVIQHLPPSYGLYISISLVGVALIINVICPEVRRATWRRSATEIRNGTTVSRRLARGEVMMHRVQNGPRWWGQEVHHGIALSLEMLRQPGFTIMAVYTAWIYAQVVLIIVVSFLLLQRVAIFLWCFTNHADGTSSWVH